jgi:hypothetical protein
LDNHLAKRAADVEDWANVVISLRELLCSGGVIEATTYERTNQQ